MKKISDERLETLIHYSEQTTKPWLCVEVAAALRELQELRKGSTRYIQLTSIGKSMKSLLVLSVLMLTGCTDAQMSGITALGSPADITCYSGNMVIYHGRSTGKVSTVTNSDGWEFRDATTQRFVRVSGPCVVLN